MPRPGGRDRLARRLVLVWLVLPLVALILGLRSCARSPGPDRPLQLRTRMDQRSSSPSDGLLDPATRGALRNRAAALGVATLIPARTSPSPTMRGNARVVITDATPDGALVYTYLVGGEDSIDPSLVMTISPLDRVCTDQSAIDWQQPVPIRAATGCLARNPGARGGVFLEWVEGEHSLHVESASPDADALLAWLGSWVPA